MNESETRMKLIDPKLKQAGWGTVGDSNIANEYAITNGRVSQTVRPIPKRADYVLTYQGQKLAVVEAKSDEVGYGKGVAQAIDYATRLDVCFAYATDGQTIWQIDRIGGAQGAIETFPGPEELWQRTFSQAEEWRDKLRRQPFHSDGQRRLRYYQEVAVNHATDAIAHGEKRILLTLATGTGKTYIAFQVVWKLFQARWNVTHSGQHPRVLYLVDRNLLANQALVAFMPFDSDTLVRIAPASIRKEGRVPVNGSIFFTIYQTFECGPQGAPFFGQYPKDFFDLIIVDECHRGGANDESNWRNILEYFDSAVQIGLTATPRVDDGSNINTYRYFTCHAYTYSLCQGIDDGFLTPFRHINMKSTIDDYHHVPDDIVLAGEVDDTKTYKERNFSSGEIRIDDRDEARVNEFMQLIDPKEKTLVFCATQQHAAAIRDMINKWHNGNAEYCVRVTSDDGPLGETYLNEFRDNEKSIPTVLTTSQKLSTGVDALNVRNIVLLRPVGSMIEFKQIIGRGTRLYDGKYYFTVYDFVRAYEHFYQPEWDGDPVPVEDEPTKPIEPQPYTPPTGKSEHKDKPQTVVIKLSDGRRRSIQFATEMMFFDAAGHPVHTADFIREMFGQLPSFFTSAEELHKRWSNPTTRADLLKRLEDAGYGMETLKQIRSIIRADGSDLMDVLEYIAYATTPMERATRAARLKGYLLKLSEGRNRFVQGVLEAYVKDGVEELAMDKLPGLLILNFGSVGDGVAQLGTIENARQTFCELQHRLYCA